MGTSSDLEIKIINKAEYPENLQNIHRPPKRLWMRGKWPDLKTHRFLCVIGSRVNSSYGAEAVKKLISGLKGYPISVVSGLAIGIDSLAHEAALDAGLHCVGFPGSGLDWSVLYPKSRHRLARRIIETDGALLSEWEPMFPFTEWTFAARNRLMAGLAQATLIIEGREGSGTLKTAEYVASYGRDQLIVPGSIFSDLSYGPHMLYRDGATPITNSVELLGALGFIAPPSGAIPDERFQSLDDTSKKIISFIRRGETSCDLLLEELNVRYSELSVKLSELEMDGLIKILGGELFLA
ncbi:MAG: DNA-protecting protein DprA [Patescibacteria group bacterium]|nr:DNA-protecting protein DprA [Patescibacteria group bacterium]